MDPSDKCKYKNKHESFSDPYLEPLGNEEGSGSISNESVSGDVSEELDEKKEGKIANENPNA